MASVHWSERGQLLDLSRDRRSQRKRTRLTRANYGGCQNEDLPQRDSSAPAISRPSPQSDDPDRPEGDKDILSASGAHSGRRDRVKRGASNVDMYMSLDGSAITAIGTIFPFFVVSKLIVGIHRHASARGDISGSAIQPN